MTLTLFFASTIGVRSGIAAENLARGLLEGVDVTGRRPRRDLLHLLPANGDAVIGAVRLCVAEGYSNGPRYANGKVTFEMYQKQNKRSSKKKQPYDDRFPGGCD